MQLPNRTTGRPLRRFMGAVRGHKVSLSKRKEHNLWTEIVRSLLRSLKGSAKSKSLAVHIICAITMQT